MTTEAGALREQVHARWSTGEDHAQAIFAAEGMRCAGCARSIEKAVQVLPGVERVDVNVATSRVAVGFQPRAVSLDQVLSAVEAAGFKPVPLAGEAAAESWRSERRTAIKRMGLAGLGMMQTMMLMYGLYAVGPGDIDPGIEQLLRLTSMLLATPVLFYSGIPFLRGAWRNIATRSFGMDVPVAAALLLAFGASVFNTLRGTGQIYFDSVTMFIFFLLAGRFVEMTVRHRSLNATEALARSLPATVARVLPDGRTERIPTTSVARGDRLSIPRGAVIPVDAELAAAAALVDESLVTGESTPVQRAAGDRLLGGSVNAGAAIQVVAQADVAGSTLASIVKMLERAQAQRPRVALAADRAASWFVVAILVLAVGVAVAWMLVDPSRAFEAALAVLVVTCPCALSLATPAAIAAATARLAKLGLLVTRPDAVERLAHVTTVVIDKTGTLTAGKVRVADTHLLGAEPAERVQRIAAALERASNHPLAAAFAPFDDPAVTAAAVVEHAGQGLEGEVAGTLWRLGRRDFVAALTAPGPAAAGVPDEGLYLGSATGLEARFTVADSMRADAHAAVVALRGLGLEVVIASGDQADAVAAAARELGVSHAAGRLTPEAKIAVVQERQQRGERVLMIGDGINDGPVLAAAHVSCAMGEGSAVAQAAADLLLLNDSLATVARSVRTARRTLAVMRQNLQWALAYNLAAVPLAALGYVEPWIAAIGMSLSSLLVVLNARRITLVREEPATRPEPGRGAEGTEALA